MRPALLAAACCLVTVEAVAAAGPKAAPEPDVYIFDLLPLQPYKGSLKRLVVGKSLPDWVEAVSTRGEGTAVPGRTVEIGGTPYRLDHLCKPHDCAGNTLDVLWAPAGHKVWAALVDGGKAPVLLGDPPAAQAKALADAGARPAVAAPAQSAEPTAAAPAPAAATPAPVAAATQAPVVAATPVAPAGAPTTAPAAAATSPEPDTYVFDLLALQPYKSNLARLVKAKGLPAWVPAIVVKGEGSAGPGRTVEVGGTPDRLDRVCKPQACAGNTLDVLWAPGGRKVWAALVADGKPPLLLGKPPAAEEKVLREAAAGPAAAAHAAASPASSQALTPTPAAPPPAAMPTSPPSP